MKHLATIQTEFTKLAHKWDDLSLDEQRQYLKRHPKTKRRLTARPKGTSHTTNFNPEQKTVQAFWDNKQNFAKQYLTNIGEILKSSFPNVKLSEIENESNAFGEIKIVKFSEPISIGSSHYDIGINLDYPKIRCKNIESNTNLDSQQPISLINKIKKLSKG
jgi:hypothetical protein